MTLVHSSVSISTVSHTLLVVRFSTLGTGAGGEKSPEVYWVK